MIKKKKTKTINIGPLKIGGGNRPLIQSMTNCSLEDTKTTVNQINVLKKEGADLVRLAVKDLKLIPNLKKVIKSVDLPLIADIHFNHKIAIEAIKAGINKIRINPGNISSPQKIKEIIKAAKDYQIPIRVGVNAGSLNLKKYPKVTPENLVLSALEQIKIFEDQNFFDLIISLKSSDIKQNILANQLFSSKSDYPLHLGLTEAGFGETAIIQSSILLSHLLLNGIGDTLRVSLTGDPVPEIRVAKKILESIGLKKASFKIISCPTCGRTSPHLDLLKIAQKIETTCKKKLVPLLKDQDKTIKIAVMGCEVNGPGEAKEAEVGIAAGQNQEVLLFAKGKKIKKIKIKDIVPEIFKQIEKNYLN